MFETKILKPLEYEEACEMVLERVKCVFPNYIQIESDVFSVVLEAFAYMLVHQDQKRVNSIKALLLQFAEGEDLDNLCAIYGTERLEGAYPYAEYTFSLSAPLKSDVIIPKGLELGDDSGEHRAYLRENLLIKAGETSAVGIVEYAKKKAYAEVKCENVLTSLIFSLSAKANGNFENGGEIESDSAFGDRSILSLHSHTSAGSNKSYQYHAKSADSRIDDVAVFTELATPGIVDVYLKSEGGVDELMISRVEAALNKEYVRPLTDKAFSWFKDLDTKRSGAIVDMAYNMGLGTLKTFKNSLGFMERKDYKGAAENFRKSRWFSQVKRRGVRITEIIEKRA